ncbi:hypothetical protein [Streptantibioticus ferralitis]|uniref:XRE family transcriptional regulator n=1 Tax=Streptantibioticus ferralitis TaxID=236510 RepID=A0ABT5ZAR6_9ACTN|nr:hypothetical protein [Streptantibioticus ferralitis]MDF2260935.1 hypothetical protein [Streptantibioticus ferralitis]
MTAASNTTFHVRLVFGPTGRWSAKVDELPQVNAVNRSLSQLERHVADAIAQSQGLAVEALRLEVTRSLGDPDLDARVTKARELRDAADRLAEEARTAAGPLARIMVDRNMSVRDAGTLLGISGSTVSTLTAKSG